MKHPGRFRTFASVPGARRPGGCTAGRTAGPPAIAPRRLGGVDHEEAHLSDEDRSRLYAWVRECNEERLAEYFMSCLAPAPLSDLVTKEHLTAELTRFATKEEMHAGFDKLWAAIDKQQDSIDLLWRQREADRAEAAAQRETDRVARQAESKHQTRWLIGAFFAAAGVNVGGLAAVAAVLSGGG